MTWLFWADSLTHSLAAASSSSSGEASNQARSLSVEASFQDLQTLRLLSFKKEGKTE